MAIGASVVLLERYSPSRFLDLRAPARGDRVQHDRRHARDADASARATRRRRQPAAALLHRPDSAARASARDRAAVRDADRVRVRALREHLRHVLAPRRAALRDDRGRPPAPGARPHQRRPRHGRRRGGRRTARSASSSCATPRSMLGYYGMPRRDRRGARRRLAAHRRSRAPQRGRDVHVHLAQEGSDPAPGREPRPERGRGSTRAVPGHPRGRGHRGAGGSRRGRGEGVRHRRARLRPRRPGAARRARDPPQPVQDPPLRRGRRRAAAHPHRPRREAPAPGRAHDRAKPTTSPSTDQRRHTR